MRRSSPVQQWLDSLPTSTQPDGDDETKVQEPTSDNSKAEDPLKSLDETLTATDNTVIEPCNAPEPEDTKLEVPNRDTWKRKSLESGVLATTPQRITAKRLQRDHSVQSEGYSPKLKNPLLRDHSLQSDASGSSGSSVLNVLGARKVDAESVLIALGFGPSEKQQKLQRIPDRFLVPSKMKGISTEKFIKDEQRSMRMHDCGVFGYRGLTGNPHVPPSTIVAKIMDRILQDDVSREEALLRARHSIADMRTPTAQDSYAAILATRIRNL